MTLNKFLELLLQPTFLVIVSSFTGALIGEFNREVNDNIPCSFFKFLANFIASWLIGVSVSLIIQSIFAITKIEVVFAISAFIGFVGHKESIKFGKRLIESKFGGKIDKDD